MFEHDDYDMTEKLTNKTFLHKSGKTLYSYRNNVCRFAVDFWQRLYNFLKAAGKVFFRYHIENRVDQEEAAQIITSST